MTTQKILSIGVLVFIGYIAIHLLILFTLFANRTFITASFFLFAFFASAIVLRLEILRFLSGKLFLPKLSAGITSMFFVVGLALGLFARSVRFSENYLDTQTDKIFSMYTTFSIGTILIYLIMLVLIFVAFVKGKQNL